MSTHLRLGETVGVASPTPQRVASALDRSRPLFDGYVRVSQVRDREGERFISPNLQRQEIVRWARLNGVALDVVHVELDQSGGRLNRPLLQSALERIDAGTVQGLVVAKLDRFGRSLQDAMAMITRIERAGGTFVSVAEGLDARTFIGRFSLRILFSIAELEFDRVRETWGTARHWAIARGSYLPPWLPVGYQADELRRLVPDPGTAPIAQRAFAMRLEGASYRQIGAMLEQRGIPTPAGGANWPQPSVAALLANRAYLGEVPTDHGGRAQAHRALVDAATWRAAQAGRVIGTRSGSRTGGPVSGLLRCAGCRRPMTHAVTGPARHYHCRAIWAGARCPRPASVTAAAGEHLVERAFFAALAGRRPARPNRELRARVKAARADLEQYRDHPGLLRRLGPDRFQAGIEARATRLEQAELALAADRARVAAHRQVGSVADWELRWPKLNHLDRRAAIAAQLDAAFIAAGDEPVAERFWAVPRGQATADLPQRRQVGALRPFIPDEQPLVRLRDTPDWSPARIERALRAFLSGWQHWPSNAEWLKAGGGPLLRQLDRHGGRDAWARRIGARPPRIPDPSYWTDERIRASIAEVLRDRDTWPRRAEWQLLGPGGLWSAIAPRNTEWAHAFSHHPPAERRPRQWTDVAIERTLLELAGGDRVYPTRQQFAAAGLNGLYMQLRRTGRHDDWAARLQLGLGLPRGASHRVHLGELNLLAHLLAAGPDGITTRRLAAWLGDPNDGVQVAGRLRSLAHKRLCVAERGGSGPVRWRATVPSDHPAHAYPTPPPPTERRRRTGPWPPQRMLEALQDWAEAHGRAPSCEEWRCSAPEHPCASSVIGRFVRWNAALTAAGLPVCHGRRPVRIDRYSSS